MLQTCCIIQLLKCKQSEHHDCLHKHIKPLCMALFTLILVMQIFFFNLVEFPFQCFTVLPVGIHAGIFFDLLRGCVYQIHPLREGSIAQLTLQNFLPYFACSYTFPPERSQKFSHISHSAALIDSGVVKSWLVMPHLVIETLVFQILLHVAQIGRAHV